MYSKMSVCKTSTTSKRKRHAMSWRMYSPPASPVNTINGFPVCPKALAPSLGESVTA